MSRSHDVKRAIREYFWACGVELDDDQIDQIAHINTELAAAGMPGFADNLAQLVSGWRTADALRKMGATE